MLIPENEDEAGVHLVATALAAVVTPCLWL